MLRISYVFGVRVRRLRAPQLRDRGETGPLGYAVMVSAIVLLAILVAGWGEDIANHFMGQVEDVPVPGGGGQ